MIEKQVVYQGKGGWFVERWTTSDNPPRVEYNVAITLPNGDWRLYHNGTDEAEAVRKCMYPQE